jgi:hypothetical protein
MVGSTGWSVLQMGATRHRGIRMRAAWDAIASMRRMMSYRFALPVIPSR